MIIDANFVQVTGIVFGFFSLVFTGVLSIYMVKLKGRQDVQGMKQDMVIEKVETVAVTAGVAVNKATATQRDMRAGVESRTQILGGLVTEIAEVKKIAADTLILSDGMMGNTLAIGLEAAQGRYDAAPTPENKAKLDAARKRVEEHAAKERIVEAKNAGAK